MLDVRAEWAEENGYPNPEQVKDEGTYFALWFQRMESIVVGKVWQWEQEAVWSPFHLHTGRADRTGSGWGYRPSKPALSDVLLTKAPPQVRSIASLCRQQVFEYRSLWAAGAVLTQTTTTVKGIDCPLKQESENTALLQSWVKGSLEQCSVRLSKGHSRWEMVSWWVWNGFCANSLSASLRVMDQVRSITPAFSG